MAAEHGDAGLVRDRARAFDDALQQAFAEQVARESDQAERKQRTRAHRVDVGERVGGGDASEVVGIVDDGREEVDGRDQRAIVRDAVHGRVVTRRRVDEDGGVVTGDQVTQDLRQLGQAEFAGSTGAVTEMTQADALLLIERFGRAHRGEPVRG